MVHEGAIKKQRPMLGDHRICSLPPNTKQPQSRHNTCGLYVYIYIYIYTYILSSVWGILLLLLLLLLLGVGGVDYYGEGITSTLEHEPMRAKAWGAKVCPVLATEPNYEPFCK